jgi:NAD(P)-dependent dehydrogenase (short-subunit alcohol dehydrogenase family)
MSTTFFVTGASSGIGAAVLNAVPDFVDHTVTFSRTAAIGEWISTDLSDPRSWQTVGHTIDSVLEQDQPEHAILFHCSGAMSPITALADADPEEYVRTVVLIRATLLLAGSPAAHKVLPATSHYSAGKAALEQWGKCAAVEQSAQSGNRVITVVPYAVLTDMVRDVMKQDPGKVPIVNYFRQVEADDGFATAKTTAGHIWAVIDSARNGHVIPVSAVPIGAQTP